VCTCACAIHFMCVMYAGFVLLSFYFALKGLRNIIVCASVSSHNSKTMWPTSPNFLAMARSSSNGIAICYVLLVLRMTSCFMVPIGGQTGMALCTNSVVDAGRGQAAVGKLARKQSCCPGGHEHVTSPGLDCLAKRANKLRAAYILKSRFVETAKQ